jgi:cytochrome c6
MRVVSLCLVAASALLVVPTLAQAGNPVAGKKVFEDNCVSCHGPDGVALVPGVPNFAKGERLEKPDSQLLMTIQNGLNVMPSWRGVITDTQIADALSYARTLRK